MTQEELDRLRDQAQAAALRRGKPQPSYSDEEQEEITRRVDLKRSRDRWPHEMREIGEDAISVSTIISEHERAHVLIQFDDGTFATIIVGADNIGNPCVRIER